MQKVDVVSMYKSELRIAMWGGVSTLLTLALLIAVTLVPVAGSVRQASAATEVTPTAEAGGTGFKPRAIVVDNTYNFEREWTSSTVTYPWSTDITFVEAEAAIGAEHPPFLDACWFSKDIPVTPTISNMSTYNTGACLPIKQLRYSNGVITVVPTDNAAYPGNQDVDLTYTVDAQSTIAAEISKHVVFRYADPDLYTRLTFDKSWDSNASPKASGVGLQDMGTYYTQLAARANANTNYHSTVTLECERWCIPGIAAHNNDSHFVSAGFVDGESVPTISNDTSTSTRTIQTFTVQTSGTAEIDFLSTNRKNMKLSASVESPIDKDFGHDIGGYSVGGNPPYVRKIFAGTGYGTNLNASGGSVSAGNANGCTMNGTSYNPNPSCTSDWYQNSTPSGASSSVNGKQVYWVDNTRQDNCVYRMGYSCNSYATNASNARYAHVASGAGGGCGTDKESSRNAYNCLNPRNAPALSLGDWENPTASGNRQYKIWFDHLENDSTQKENFNYYLGELWINGESITIPESFFCATSPAFYQSSKSDCENLSRVYNSQGYQMLTNYKNYGSRSIDFSTFKSTYQTARGKWLTTPELLSYTFTKGPNAGTTVKVSVKNVRIAGEFKGMIDDPSSDVDYSGYCDPWSGLNVTGTDQQSTACGWARDGYQKGVLLSTRYEVTIIAPQQVNTTVQAVYYNTANTRYVSTGMAGVYHSNEGELNNVQIWSAPVASGTNNNDPNSWVALCSVAERYSGINGCGYSYVRQFYTGYDPGLVRFRVRNGYAPAGNGQINLRADIWSRNSVQVTTSFVAQTPSGVTDDPNGRYIYFNVRKVTDGALNPSSSVTMGMNPFVLLRNNLEIKDFTVMYLDSNYTSLAAAGLNPVTGLDVANNPTFTASRPNVQSLGGRQFTNWKLVWCAPAVDGNDCPATGTNGEHELVYSRSSTTDGNDTQGNAIELNPGELFDINMVYHLTDPKADATYNSTHDHMALVANTDNTVIQPNLYGTVKQLDKDPAQIYGEPVNLFIGAPGLTATMHETPWDSNTTGSNETITDDGTTYTYHDTRSTRSAVLGDNPFPLVMLYTPPITNATLTLVRRIDNIFGDVWPYTDSDLPYISLGVQNDQGQDIAGQSDASHGDRIAYSVPTGTYTLNTSLQSVPTPTPSGVSSTVDMLQPALSSWSCVDDDTHATMPLSFANGKHTVAITAGTHVTCTIAYNTSNVMTLAKVEGGASVDLSKYHMTLQATDGSGNALTSLPADGAHIFSKSPYLSAALDIDKNTPQVDGSNLTRVRPGSAFTLAPQGDISDYVVHIQQFAEGLEINQANLSNDNNWSDLSLTDGKAFIRSMPERTFGVYRLVLTPVAYAYAVTLPLTGGTAQDYIIITGLVLSAGAITVLAVRRRRSRNREVGIYTL